jgi:hypothetical protein
MHARNSPRAGAVPAAHLPRVRSARCQTIVICLYTLQSVHIIIAEHKRVVSHIIILYYYKAGSPTE